MKATIFLYYQYILNHKSRHRTAAPGSVSFMEAATEALQAMQRAHAGEPSGPSGRKNETDRVKCIPYAHYAPCMEYLAIISTVSRVIFGSWVVWIHGSTVVAQS